MGLIKTYLNAIKWQPIIGIIAIFCIVMSSCAVKASIKSHLGVQHTATQKTGLNKQGNTFISSSAIDCCYVTEVKALNILQPDVKLGGTSIALLACFVFTFFGFSFLTKQKRHPLYNSDQITGALPIFLQYRKLII
jgi:hypothetical protein